MNYTLKYFDEYHSLLFKKLLSWQLYDTDNILALMKKHSEDEYFNITKTLTNTFNKDKAVVADLGCGLGRSSIFFNKMISNNCTFLFLDGHKKTYGDWHNSNEFQTGYHTNDNFIKSKISFYNDFDLLQRFLYSNDLHNFTLIDMNNHFELKSEKIDLLYSFHSVGYHYDPSIIFKYYNIEKALKKGAYVILGVRKEIKTPELIDRNIEKKMKSFNLKLVHYSIGQFLQDYMIFEKN